MQDAAKVSFEPTFPIFCIAANVLFGELRADLTITASRPQRDFGQTQNRSCKSAEDTAILHASGR